jgi:hypothetical protein
VTKALGQPAASSEFSEILKSGFTRDRMCIFDVKRADIRDGQERNTL